jgi:tripartite-type tricarboxylate transporter receptor subunit TctC
MKFQNLRKCIKLGALALSCIATLGVSAQEAAPFPSKPVRIVMPVPTGGASDTSARLIAQALSAAWGQPVIVENKPGANGAIAAQAVISAPPDGYTLLWGLSSMAGMPFVQKASPYKSLTEFAPVSSTVQFGYALYVNKGMPVQSVADLKAYARAHPDALNLGTNTLGEYMASVEVLKSAGIKATRIPYKGGSQLMTDLIGGQLQINVGPILSGAPHVQASKIRALAVLDSQRSRLFPDVPTLAELGLPAMTSPTWNALFAPPGTPREVTEKISAAVVSVLRSTTLRTTLEQQSASPAGGSPQQLSQAVHSAIEAWKTFVRDYEIPQE